MANANLLVPFIKEHEGGFCIVKGDRGGATNIGVTIDTYRHYYGASKTANDLKNMSSGEWFHIFKAGFWDRWKADNIRNQSVASILVDWLWASGKWGIIIPQRILKVKPDGIVGDKTIFAVNAYNQRDLFDYIKTERIAFVHNIVENNPSQKKFLQGWVNRINSLKFYES